MREPTRGTPCETEPAVRLLSGCILFRGCSEDELVAFLPALEPVMQCYKKGEVITQIGDPAVCLGLVVSGVAAERRPVSCASPHVLSRHKQGDLLGVEASFSGPRRSPVEYVAATDCEILRFHYGALLGPNRLVENLALLLANNSVRKTLKLDVLAAPTLRSQLMTFFQAMRDKQGCDTFHIRMTQVELAEYLNTNRSYLSRELNNMQREGILQILPNGSYHIMKWKTEPPGRRAHERTGKNDMG